MARYSKAALLGMYAETRDKDEIRERRARGEEVRDRAHLHEIKQRETAPRSERPLREGAAMTKTLTQLMREASTLSEADRARMTPEQASEAERRLAERVRDLTTGWIAEGALERPGQVPDGAAVLRQVGLPRVAEQRDLEPVSEARAQVLRENFNAAANVYGKKLGMPIREVGPDEPAPTAAQVEELMDKVEQLAEARPETWTAQDIHGNDQMVQRCHADGCQDGVTSAGQCTNCAGKGYVPLRESAAAALREAGLPVVKQREPVATLEDFRAFLAGRWAA